MTFLWVGPCVAYKPFGPCVEYEHNHKKLQTSKSFLMTIQQCIQKKIDSISLQIWRNKKEDEVKLIGRRFSTKLNNFNNINYIKIRKFASRCVKLAVPIPNAFKRKINVEFTKRFACVHAIIVYQTNTKLFSLSSSFLC